MTSNTLEASDRPAMDKACCQCRHYLRARIGPHYWEVDCAMKQRAFFEAGAEDCALYEEGPAVALPDCDLLWRGDDE